jgi:uncharacterized membrane-anchored protein YitT (DUF2179 family)
MNAFVKKLVLKTIYRKRQKKFPGQGDYSRFELAKEFLELKITAANLLRDAFFMAMGVLSAAFGLESFLIPNSFIDGGATGISLLTTEMVAVPLFLPLLIINIPFVLLGYKIVGKQFAVKTAIAISCLALCVATVHFPQVTHDKLLVAVFGGFFLGAGIGLSVRGGAVIDGTEVMAIYLSRKLGTTIGDIIILINIVVFSAAAYLLSIEAALYSMITYLAASKTLDFIVEGIEEYTGVTIISSHHDEIRSMIINEMGRGVTVYRGKRGFGKHGETHDTDIVYTVITRLELNRLNTEIEKIDPHAFVIMSSVKDTRGGMIKKRPLKH